MQAEGTEVEELQFIMSRIVFTAWMSEPSRLKLQSGLMAAASMLPNGKDGDNMGPLLSECVL